MEPTRVRKNFGQRVRFLRQQKGWSQWGMELETGLSRTLTSLIERGKVYVSVSTMCRYADAFKITISHLLSGVDAPNPSSKDKTKHSPEKSR